MRSLLPKFLLIFILFVSLFTVVVPAQQMINPVNQINWKAITGTGPPIQTCTTTIPPPYGQATLGQPYIDLTNLKLYTCDTPGTGGTGWVIAGGDNATSIQGYAVDATTPIESASLIFNTTTGTYNVRQLTADDIAAGFGITYFNCSNCGPYEIGTSIANTYFTEAFSGTPTSATIINTDGHGSPLVLTTPFTPATVTGPFTKTVQGNITFTLTTTNGTTTKTSIQIMSFLPRSFGGIGSAGASSHVTATGTPETAVLNTTDILASAGINSTNVNQVFGPYNPVSQKIYILCMGGSHVFKDYVTGFSFAFNVPTAVSFTNTNGATLTMYLYESTNLLSGSYSILVVN